MKITLNKIVSFLNMKQSNENIQTTIKQVINNEDFKPIINNFLNDGKSITFIIPGIYPYSGGLTSILRLGTFLANEGYDVSYITYEGQLKTELQSAARENLENYRGTVYDNSYLYKLKSDIIIATSWQSVYYAKKMDGYKMYFIQDYEPYFYQYGEEYLLAKKTYGFGFHMVSLGSWNAKKIKNECSNTNIDVIHFPYEEKEYHYRARDYSRYKNKKEIKLVVYIKNQAKRIPNLIQVILSNLKNQFEKDGIALTIYYFGLSKKNPVIAGNNLGELNKKQLEELYFNADFGMVASMTNISLIPFEMLATGLPLIEFEDGTFKDFFPDNSAILTSFDYVDLYNKLKYYIDNPTEIEKMQKTALDYLKGLSWKRSCEEFKDIIKNIQRR